MEVELYRVRKETVDVPDEWTAMRISWTPIPIEQRALKEDGSYIGSMDRREELCQIRKIVSWKHGVRYVAISGGDDAERLRGLFNLELESRANGASHDSRAQGFKEGVASVANLPWWKRMFYPLFKNT